MKTEEKRSTPEKKDKRIEERPVSKSRVSKKAKDDLRFGDSGDPNIEYT